MSVFALLWLLALPPGAPPRVISGAVEDLAGGAAGGATVSVECGATVVETTTDAGGTFEVTGLPPGGVWWRPGSDRSCRRPRSST